MQLGDKGAPQNKTEQDRDAIQAKEDIFARTE